MAKPELGTKRTCPSCGRKYYDLNRDPIVCPNCGAVFVIAAPLRPERPPPEPKVEVREEPVVVEREEGVVSLEEAEEPAQPDVGPELEPEEAEAAIPDVEVEEAEIENTAADDTFLEEDEEEGDDVSGLLDVDAEEEEER
ncbi:MAG: TIGR02300 family protein [Propylenella sp.]